jgi:predicted DCC family thiol-disulfide oxidoreductase YuxK
MTTEVKNPGVNTPGSPNPGSPETDSPAKGKAVVLYDGQCPFCQRSVRSLKRLDWLHKLHFQDCRDTANLPPSEVPLDPARMLEEMHVVTPDRKRVYAGYRAVRWIAWRIPVLLPFAWMMYIPGVPWLGTRAYRWIATNRYNIGPCQEGACQAPGIRGQKTEDRGQKSGNVS